MRRARPGFSWPLALIFVAVGILAGGVAHFARSDFDRRGFVPTPDGLRLAYELQGEGPPLVALAGGPGISHHGFHPHLHPLRRAARLVYFDPRGRGDSGSAAAYSVGADVADLEALRTGVRLGRLDLLGVSYGAHLAARGDGGGSRPRSARGTTCRGRISRSTRPSSGDRSRSWTGTWHGRISSGVSARSAPPPSSCREAATAPCWRSPSGSSSGPCRGHAVSSCPGAGTPPSPIKGSASRTRWRDSSPSHETP